MGKSKQQWETGHGLGLAHGAEALNKHHLLPLACVVRRIISFIELHCVVSLFETYTHDSTTHCHMSSHNCLIQ